MKRIIYPAIMMAILFNACASEPHYLIKAEIDGSDGELFLLQKRVDGEIVAIDSAISGKGSFKMEGSVEYPDIVQIIAVNTGDRVSFYIENSDINITGTLDSLFDARITGSKTQDEYQSLIDSDKPLSEKYENAQREYQIARQVNDTQKMSQYETELDEIDNEMMNLQKEFVRNNPSSYVTPSILKSLSYYLGADEIEGAINALDTNVAKVPVVKDLKELAIAMKPVSIGKKAPDFTLTDVTGNPVSLSSKTGAKLLLVDFWAAWCTPCRLENPNLVRIYNEFNKKGFDIFGVSLDQSKDDWTKAIADDKLTWTHVSDLQYFNNAAARLYAVNAIPANFLLDESGIIIARNLRGKDLYDKVIEVLGK